MPDHEIDYLNYPIIVLNPTKKVISWQKELEKDLLFYTVSGLQECLKILTTRKNIAAVVCPQIENDKQFWKAVKKDFPQINIFSFLPFDHFIRVKSSPSKKLFYHPLLKSSPPDILHSEFAQTIERYVWKQERDFLLTIKKQENWFSLIGQLTREWAHEIKNHISIISLNAEISMLKARKSLAKPINLENMKKIINQSQKISGVLDGLRDLAKVGQSGLSSLPLTKTIEQAVSMLESKNFQNQTIIKITTKLSLSHTESILLRSALVNILQYFSQIKNDRTLLYILINKKQSAFWLTIQLKDIATQAFSFSTDYVEGPIKKIVHIEKKKRDFYIGVRLLKSLGGEISIEKNEAEKVITFKVILPLINSNKNST